MCLYHNWNWSLCLHTFSTLKFPAVVKTWFTAYYALAERQFAPLQVKYNDPNAHTRPFSCPLFPLRAPRAKLPNLISSGDTFKSALFQPGRSSFSFGARFAREHSRSLLAGGPLPQRYNSTPGAEYFSAGLTRSLKSNLLRASRWNFNGGEKASSRRVEKRRILHTHKEMEWNSFTLSEKAESVRCLPSWVKKPKQCDLFRKCVTSSNFF